MTSEQIRKTFTDSPGWTIVGLFNRIEQLEKDIQLMKEKPKRTRKKAIKNGTN